MTTIDLTQLTNDAMAKAVESGTLKTAIERGVSKAIEEIAREATGYGSPFRKMLEDAVKEMLEFDPKTMGVTGYNAAVLAIIKTKLDAILDDQLANQFSKEMEALLVQAPKEITITKLASDFKRWAIKDCQTDGDYCTVRIDRTQYGSRWVRLDPKGRKGEHDCRFALLIGNDGALAHFSDGGRDMKAVILSKRLHGFPRDLFQMMAAGTKVVFDTMEIDGSLIDYSDDEDEGED